MGFRAFLKRLLPVQRKQGEPPDSPNHEASPSTQATPLLIPTSRDAEAIQQTTLNKLDRRVLPYCLLISVISYIDRGNLGFVAADVCAELNMNHARYGIGVGCFGVGYALSQVPSNYFLRYWGARIWFALLLLSWGLVAGSFSLVQNRYEFYVLRLLLGVVEGGTYPGSWYYLSNFYPEQHLMFPFSAIESSVAVSGPLAAPLAAGLVSLDGLFGIDGWRLLFFVEGIIPIIYALVIYWTLPSTPEEASFLKQDERDWIASQERQGTEERHLLRELKTVLRSVDLWGGILSGMLRGVLYIAAFYWTTLIIDDMLNGDDDDDDDDSCAASNSTDVAAVVLSAVPLGLSAILTLVFGRVASRIGDRSKACIWFTLSSAVFLAGWVIFRNVSFVVALLCIGLAIAGFIISDGLCIAVLSTCFDQETRATGVAAYNAISAVGMAFGPIVLGIVVDNHGYVAGVGLLTGVAVMSAAFMIVVKDPLLKTKRPQTTEQTETFI